MLFPEKGRSGFIQELLQFHGYRVLSEIGRGSGSTVYLAEHQKLGEYRAVKCISRDHPNYTRLLWEASLLKHLKHPQIPILYDIIEDNTSLYLVEEFIEGESLEAFMLHQQFITPNFIFDIGIKLCSVLSYLHGQKPYPVIYQDLKPEHIRLCGNLVKIIDFDIAANLSGQGNKFQNYGTLQFSAPEKQSEAIVDVRTDIYALGRLLELLVISGHTAANQSLKHILRKATQKEPAKRYTSVEHMMQDLEMAKEDMHQKHNPVDGKHLLKNIIVVGSQNHIGVTHLSISLTVYFNQQGTKAVYLEKNNNNDVMKSAQENGRFTQRNGLYRNKSFYGLPFYGPGVSIEPDADAVQIKDYGTNREDASQETADLWILILGSRDWEMDAAESAYRQMQGQRNLVIVSNFGEGDKVREYANRFGRKVYGFPLDASPYHLTQKKALLFRQLLEVEGGKEKENDKPDRWDRKRFPWKRSHTFWNWAGKLCSQWIVPKDGIR